MGSSYIPLQFPIEVGNPQPLRDLAAILQQTQQVTGASNVTMKLFNYALVDASKNSVNLTQALGKVQAASRGTDKEMAELAKTARILVSEQDKVAASALREAAAQEAAAKAADKAAAAQARAAERAVPAMEEWQERMTKQ